MNLIIGSSCFIGHYLIQNINRRDTITLSRSNDSFLSIDFFHLNSFDELLHNIDNVYFLLSFKNVDFYDSSQVRSIISYLKFFFKSVKNSNIKKFFYFSSGGAIYGKNNSRLITEDSPLNPCSSYGLEKKIIEDLIIDILWEAKNIRTYILRPSNIYGFSPFLKSHGIVHKLNIAFLNKITFDINSSLDTIRDYIYINDLIDAVNFINKSNCDSNIFNVGSSIGTSTSDVIQIVQSIHKNQISINIANKNITSTNHISSNILNIDKIKHITNWIPKTIFFDGIVETCAKYKSFYEK